MSDIGVRPYWELTFDAEGRCDPGERDALLGGVAQNGLSDLVVFSHGWNNTRTSATALYRRFFAPFPTLLAGAAHPGGLGYTGVIWPSMRFTDEPVPDFPASPATATALDAAWPVLEPATLQALARVFPGSEALLDRLAELLERRPDDPAALAEFVGLARRLTTAGRQGAADGGAGSSVWAYDLEEGAGEPAEPTMFSGDPERACAAFAEALSLAGVARTDLFGAVRRLWSGALELLRQAAYWEMKRRAGVVGQAGLGPVLGALAMRCPGVRVHLVGHSFGARLVAFALRGLPVDARCVGSLTLLQGAFSHYAFASRLPFDSGKGGALRELQARVNGPVVCCHSRLDTALGVLYPLASLISGDADSVRPETLLGVDAARWGAMGHDGVQAVAGTARATLAEALAGPLPATGCVNVDAAAVVRLGGPPTGAHSDICHAELARLVLLAGRVMR
ncbi:serine-threonine protein kinase [Streptomyces sp. NPDC049585]|uniref:serine-threonine protein kinase n=1 Tax=Streptomyces sp. NPDC049585 TaxID=3155154 RepID=UPI0034372237